MILFSCLFSALTAQLPTVKIGPNGIWVDDAGRERFFHGVNAVVKEHPWLPSRGSFDSDMSLGAEDIANLRKWGFTAVRLGVMWPGVEISPGVYNTTYLQSVNELINDLGKAGIYTLVDMHQDLLSRHFCGEGMPEFYVENLLKDPNSLLSKGRDFPIGLAQSEKYPNAENSTYPALELCLSKQFATYYLSDAVGRLFQTLYTPGTVVQEGFINTWVEIAKALKGNTNVLGFELLNEPWYGDTASDPLLFLESTTDRDYLQPLYLATTEKIREIDATRTISFEEMPFSIRPVEFTKNPGDPQSVLSYHIYCSAHPWKPGCEYGMEELMMHKFNKYIDDNHIGGMLTEFGAIADEKDLVEEIRFLLDLADERKQSWTYWQFKLFNDITTASDAESLYFRNGTLETTKVKLLTRSYARAVAGKTNKLHFDTTSGEYTLEFVPTPGLKDTTEIFVSPDFWAENGVNVTASAVNCGPKWNVDASNGAGLVVFVDTSSCDGKSPVTITVTPAAALEGKFSPRLQATE